MHAATVSRALTMGIILIILSLLAVGPVLAQGASRDPYLALLEQYRQMYGGSSASAEMNATALPPEALPETGAAASSLTPKGAATVQLPDQMIGPQAVPAPEQLPATGEQRNPYLQLLEQYRQMYGGY